MAEVVFFEDMSILAAKPCFTCWSDSAILKFVFVGVGAGAECESLDVQLS